MLCITRLAYWRLRPWTFFRGALLEEKEFEEELEDAGRQRTTGFDVDDDNDKRDLFRQRRQDKEGVSIFISIFISYQGRRDTDVDGSAGQNALHSRRRCRRCTAQDDLSASLLGVRGSLFKARLSSLLETQSKALESRWLRGSGRGLAQFYA